MIMKTTTNKNKEMIVMIVNIDELDTFKFVIKRKKPCACGCRFRKYINFPKTNQTSNSSY